MSLFFGRSETRAIDPTAGVLGGFATGNMSATSMKRALHVVPAYAATSLIAESLATVPVGVKEIKSDGSRATPRQPGLVINPNPNPVGSRVEWIHQYVTSLKLQGNAYGVVVAIDKWGIPEKIQWLNPESVNVDESKPSPEYFHHGQRLDKSTLVHIADYVLPGSVVGLSPVSLFRQQLEMAERAQEFGSNVYRSSGIPSGHLKNKEKTLSFMESSVVKSRFKSAVHNNDVFVSGNDWDYTSLGMSVADSKFLESIKATANQLAAIFKVPPEEIGGESGGSLTYSTVELNQLKFTMRALQPPAVRLETHMNRLLPPSQYMKFNLNANVRGDLKARMDAYKLGLESGVYTLAQVREFEDFQMLSGEEIEQWQKWFGTKAITSQLTGDAGEEQQQARQLAELIQKIYLGVGKVITAEEAREIINKGGGNLSKDSALITYFNNQNGGTPDAA
ncbi:phage portal protein [Arthrobacter sp. Hz1]